MSDAAMPQGTDPDEGSWITVGTTADLRRARSVVVASPDGDIAVFWNGGEPVALANICIHRERELVKGNIFQGRVICPGHQWAFDVTTGFCAERDRTQPVYAVRVDDDRVLVDGRGPINL